MKGVGIAELKTRLSEYLRRVRRGESVAVMDRDTPVAVLSPYDQGPGVLTVRSPSAKDPRPADVDLPPPLAVGTDAVELLLAERRAER